MRTISGLAVAATLLLAPLAGSEAALAEEPTPTCEGQEATIVGTEFQDTLYGTSGDDVIWLGGTAMEVDSYASDYVDAGSGDDLICQGGRGGVIVLGGPGNDAAYLEGRSGLDDLYADGGDGDDTLVGASGDQNILAGGDGSDVLTGGSQADELRGGTGDDQVTGGAGPDLVLEGAGSDQIDAGPGAGDRVAYSERVDTAENRDLVPLPVTVDAGTGSVTSGLDVDTVTEVECYLGTTMADTMLGSDAADCLDGAPGEGEDRVDAGGGNDLVTIWSGQADGGPGDDLVRGRYPFGQPDDTSYEPLDTAISATGGAGDDTVTVGGRRMTASGGPGRDRLSLRDYSAGLASDIEVRIDVPRTLVQVSQGDFPVRARFGGFEDYRGSQYADRFVGSSAGETFAGWRGADWATGGPGADRLTGAGGDDDLEGGGGPDVLIGGPGRTDHADGGKGHDRCDAERREECEARA